MTLNDLCARFKVICSLNAAKMAKYSFGLDWIEQDLTSPPTQYRLSGRQFYRSKDPTNSIKVLKEKLVRIFGVGL